MLQRLTEKIYYRRFQRPALWFIVGWLVFTPFYAWSTDGGVPAIICGLFAYPFLFAFFVLYALIDAMSRRMEGFEKSWLSGIFLTYVFTPMAAGLLAKVLIYYDMPGGKFLYVLGREGLFSSFALFVCSFLFLLIGGITIASCFNLWGKISSWFGKTPPPSDGGSCYGESDSVSFKKGEDSIAFSSI